MITKEELFQAGKITRTHGVMGEMVCMGNTDVLDECSYLELNMDGLFVPFFIASRRYQNNTSWLIQLEGIESEQKAKNLVGKEIFLPLAWQEDAEQVSYAYFVDFEVYNNNELVGTIVEVNDQTENVLFCIETEKGICMVPAVEAFMVDIDHKSRKLYMDFPEALLSIND
jgi:16S rRNA processing protein RimM